MSAPLFRLLATAASEEGHARFEIPAASPLFAGHFTGNPILPGIAHLALVARALAGGREDPALAEIRTLRLRRPVAPGDLLDLKTERQDGWLHFELRHGEAAVSQGTLRPAAEGESAAAPEPLPLETGSGFPAPALLLPHAPPALLVRGVVEAAAEAIVCLAVIPADHPLVADGCAPAYLGLEAAAQAAAMLEALDRGAGAAGSAPRLGYLVGVRDARCRAPFLPPERPLRVAVRLTGSAPPLAVYEATVGAGDEEWVVGTISTFLA
jgi:3-hydroxymyristoyl/3-hydroxydecanoyl-(acyl carrier protein) dehydratase